MQCRYRFFNPHRINSQMQPLTSGGLAAAHPLGVCDDFQAAGIGDIN